MKKKATQKGLWNTIHEMGGHILLETTRYPKVFIKNSLVEQITEKINDTYKDVEVLISEHRFQVKSTISGRYITDYAIAKRY